MSDMSGEFAFPAARRSVVLGLGRPQERRLLAALRDDARIRISTRCSSAPQVLACIQQGAAEVALLDEDLHLLDDDHLGYLAAARITSVVLVRDPEQDRWHSVDGLAVLPADTEPADVLSAIVEARRGYHRRRPRREEPRDPGGATPQASGGVGRLQVLAFWSGPGSPGRTTLAINWGVLLGWVARTVIVDLDLTASAVSAQLDEMRGGLGMPVSVASSILQLASVNPESQSQWQHEIFRVARPLGAWSPHADMLAGVLQPWLRQAISAGFVEQLVAELRRHYDYVLLDLGDEPLGEPTREAAVSAAALRTADQVVVVCPPDAAGLHRLYMALAQAGTLIDPGRAGIVVNRSDGGHHRTTIEQIEEAFGLPLVGVLPLDTRAVERALSEGRPVVCDRRSKLRRPLQELAERVHGGRVEQPAPKGGRITPVARARSAVAAFVGTLGAGALGGVR